jgi:DNA-binding transcriptional ArsR family regulator
MALGSIASPATIHRKLDCLRDMGLVDAMFEGNNRRTKYLVPTTQAQCYFDTVRAFLLQACSVTQVS